MGRMIDADALEVVTAKVPKGMDTKSYMAGMEYVLSQIDALPTIEERKTGKWIDYIGHDLGIEGQWLRDDGKTVFVQCDQCKSLHVRNFMNHWHWCPRCGCKMKGEQP